MGDLAWLDGTILPLAEAHVPVGDRGFLFGDGVYEVVRSYAGRLWMAAAHWQRLARSLSEIGIAGVDLGALAGAADDLLQRAGEPEALLYVQITRGAMTRRKHTWDASLRPTVLMTVSPAPPVDPQLRQDGCVCISHPDWRWARCDIKSTCLLPYVLAKQKAVEAGAFEAIFVEPDGTITEGTSTSVLAVLNGQLRTHPAGARILPGITRQRVLALADELGLPVCEEPCHLLSLRRAEELFLVGTTTEVQPVVRVDQQTIGAGVPGPVTRQLQEAFAAAVSAARE